ncbi:MAG: alpha/beta hydrolase [Flavobacteriaceae bacterium]|nr:alpha/beta hydrolase [Flavobacteriaceae bacterium]
MGKVSYIVLIILFSLTLTSFAQSSFILPIWKGEIPNQIKSDEKETQEYREPGLLWIENVQIPTIEVFLPAKANANGQAVLICPGGGYGGLAYDWEGTDIAKLLNARGIAGIVLKYRIPNPKNFTNSREVPLQDAQRAIRLVRYHAKKWNILPEKIGIMGFSAGGHLASTLGTHFDVKTSNINDSVNNISAKPNFMILVYPVISMNDNITHEGSKRALLGKEPKQSLVDYYSNELQVKSNTPSTFMIHSTDDDAVPVENSIEFYKALKEKQIAVEMHIYPDGGHGFSLALNNKHLNTWPQRLFEWLQILK